MDSRKENEKIFGEIACDLEFITKEDILDAVLKQTSESFEEKEIKHISVYLFELGKLNKENIKKILSIQKRYKESELTEDKKEEIITETQDMNISKGNDNAENLQPINKKEGISQSKEEIIIETQDINISEGNDNAEKLSPINKNEDNGMSGAIGCFIIIFILFKIIGGCIPDNTNHSSISTKPSSILKEDWKTMSSERLNTLLKNGANINARDENGWTPLMSACFQSNSKIIEMLLKNGADVNARKKDGSTVLVYAVLSACNSEIIDNSEIIEILLKNGANVNARNEDGRTPLMYADNNRNPEIKKLLIRYGAR